LEKISPAEAQFVARDLKEIFTSSGDKYKIRASYGLLKISIMMLKNNYFNEALDYCNFILVYGLSDSYGLKVNDFSKQIIPHFLSSVAVILPVTAGQRKTKEWIALADFFMKYQNKINIKIAEKQFFLIKEAVALNLLDNAFKDGNIQFLYDIINYYKGTYTYKTAEKIINVILKEKEKNKGIELKYILLNNNVIYDIYKKSSFEIDNFINKASVSFIKK
ncbi:MAG: hypothetical protein N3E50_01840, partial [Candidatus Goldbacteria bacterium]|nr:hypothetical protein [Candidatus Goldiibacteriota bacterium]